MKNEALQLGKNLKRVRIAKNMTQGDIVRKLNVGRGFISNIENGKANPTLSTIAKLAKAVGAPIEDLIK